MSSNVIQFPKESCRRPELTIDMIINDRKVIRDIHIEESIMVSCESLFEHLEMMRIDLNRPELMNNINLVVESVRALLLLYYGDDSHPLNKVIENNKAKKTVTFEPVANGALANCQVEFTNEFEF